MAETYSWCTCCKGSYSGMVVGCIANVAYATFKLNKVTLKLTCVKAVS